MISTHPLRVPIHYIILKNDVKPGSRNLTRLRRYWPKASQIFTTGQVFQNEKAGDPKIPAKWFSRFIVRMRTRHYCDTAGLPTANVPLAHQIVGVAQLSSFFIGRKFRVPRLDFRPGASCCEFGADTVPKPLSGLDDHLVPHAAHALR